MLGTEEPIIEQPEIEQPEQQEQEVHTDREIELEKKVKALESKIDELVKTNQKLYIRLGGGDKPTKTPAERTDEKFRAFIDSHFSNFEMLRED